MKEYYFTIYLSYVAFFGAILGLIGKSCFEYFQTKKLLNKVKNDQKN